MVRIWILNDGNLQGRLVRYPVFFFGFTDLEGAYLPFLQAGLVTWLFQTVLWVRLAVFAVCALGTLCWLNARPDDFKRQLGTPERRAGEGQ